MAEYVSMLLRVAQLWHRVSILEKLDTNSLFRHDSAKMAEYYREASGWQLQDMQCKRAVSGSFQRSNTKRRTNKEFGCPLGCQHDKARRVIDWLWLPNGAGDGTRTRTDV
jgi:hypothetical protein